MSFVKESLVNNLPQNKAADNLGVVHVVLNVDYLKKLI